ncbi:MAG: MarR family transcriptional regulator [Solirubrobacteraceae bacterium]
MARSKTKLTDADYERLAEFRYGLRRFLHWSEQQARAAGITPTQHQLLLTIRSSRDPRGATVGEVAEVLIIRHHSAVGLIDRAQEAGLISRERDPDTQSVVHLKLTEFGALTLSALSEVHLRELAQLAPTMQALIGELSESEAADLMLMRLTR